MDELAKYWSDRGKSVAVGVDVGEDKDTTVVVFTATRVPLSRSFELPTEGANPRLDALSVCEDVLRDLLPYERRAILQFLLSTVAVE